MRYLKQYEGYVWDGKPWTVQSIIDFESNYENKKHELVNILKLYIAWKENYKESDFEVDKVYIWKDMLMATVYQYRPNRKVIEYPIEEDEIDRFNEFVKDMKFHEDTKKYNL